MNIHTDGGFVCGINGCKSKFTAKVNLLAHQKNSCGKKRKKSIQTLQPNSSETEKNIFKCNRENCERTFKTIDELDCHNMFSDASSSSEDELDEDDDAKFCMVYPEKPAFIDPRIEPIKKLITINKIEDLNVVKELLPNIGYLDKKNRTALHYAAACGNLELIQICLESNIYIYSKDLDGNTALHFAAKRNCISSIRKLIESGFKNIDIENNNGETALHSACFNGNRDSKIFN